MKKVITMLLVGLMLVGSFSVTFAEEPDTALSESFIEETGVNKKLNLLKEFTDEIHRLNAIKIERNQLQIQVIEKHDSLIDLVVAARDAGNKEALTAAKETKQQLKALNDEIGELHEQAKAVRHAFKEALNSRNAESAHQELENLINIHTSINEIIEEKIQVLNTIIDILL